MAEKLSEKSALRIAGPSLRRGWEKLIIFPASKLFIEFDA